MHSCVGVTNIAAGQGGDSFTSYTDGQFSRHHLQFTTILHTPLCTITKSLNDSILYQLTIIVLFLNSSVWDESTSTYRWAIYDTLHWKTDGCVFLNCTVTIYGDWYFSDYHSQNGTNCKIKLCLPVPWSLAGEEFPTITMIPKTLHKSHKGF